MTFVDSIVSGREQKRRFVFTQNGGGEVAEGEGRSHTSCNTDPVKDKIEPCTPSPVFFSSHNSAVTQVANELIKCKLLKDSLQLWFSQIDILVASGDSLLVSF